MTKPSTAAERAIALRPASPAAYDVIGRALAGQGRVADAANAFARALQIAPGDPDANEALRRLRPAIVRGRLH